MLTNYFPIDSRQSFNLTNQHTEVQLDHVMKETASRHVNVLKVLQCQQRNQVLRMPVMKHV